MKDLNKINNYLLKKKELFIIEKTEKDILGEKVSPNIVFGMLANLDTWGYTINPDMIPILMELSEDTLVNNFYEPLVQTLKEIKGDDVSHDNFLFKNFPDSCRAMDPEELSSLRFASYFTGMIDYYFETNITHEIDWDGKREDRKEPGNVSKDKLRIINEGTIEDFETMIKNLLSSKAALSQFDKEIIEFALKSEEINNKNIIPENIPFKENWAYLFKFAFENPEIKIPMDFKNFDDFVRACVALSEGDISLSEKPKLRNFKNQERKRLLTMLNKASKKYPEVMKETMMTPANRRFINNVLKKGWHIEQNFNGCASKVIELSNQALVEHNKRGMFEKLIKSGKYVDAAKVALNISPGEFARKLNLLLTKSNDNEQKEIVKLASKVLDKVSIDILLNLKNNIENLNNQPIKVAFPKGSSLYAHAFENRRASECMINTFVKANLINLINQAIVQQLKDNKPLGKVYIDPALKDCPVPFSSRNESGENRSVERGTKINMHKNIKAIRAFCYKKDKHSMFVDLSATFLDKNFNMVEQCSWTNLRTKGEHPLAVHSGDNDNISKGYTEFIDIDLGELNKLAKEKGVQYVAFHVLSYNHVPFKNIERCFFGIMERDAVGNDEVRKDDIEKLDKNDRYWKNQTSCGSNSVYYHQLTDEQRKFLGYKQERVFDPATVEFRNDIISNGIANIPMIYDVKNEKFIVADIECRSDSPFISVNCIPTAEKVKLVAVTEDEAIEFDAIKNPDNFTPMENGSGLFAPVSCYPTVEELHGAAAQACYAIVNMDKPNLHDLAVYNAYARGKEIVADIKEADTIFCVSKENLSETKENAEIITVYDRDIITADMLITNIPEIKEPEMEI